MSANVELTHEPGSLPEFCEACRVFADNIEQERARHKEALGRARQAEEAEGQAEEAEGEAVRPAIRKLVRRGNTSTAKHPEDRKTEAEGIADGKKLGPAWCEKHKDEIFAAITTYRDDTAQDIFSHGPGRNAWIRRAKVYSEHLGKKLVKDDKED